MKKQNANRKNDSTLNYFGTSKITFLYVEYCGGQLLDLVTKQPIEIKEGANLKITACLKDVPDDFHKEVTQITEKKVLSKGDCLYFYLGYKFNFQIQLLEDLYFTKKLNKSAVAKRCKVIVNEMRDSKNKIILDFTPIEVNSLSQAYFQTSMKHSPESKFHNINIYDNFLFSTKFLSKKLKDLRF
jgi:hypothetical protein